MKKRSVFIYVMLMLLVSVLTAADEKKAGQKSTGSDAIIQALDCTTSVPTEGKTNEPISFNGPSGSSDEPGGLVFVDTIIGNMRFVPATDQVEGFLQGSPLYEPGHNTDEGSAFYHILTRNLAVMDSEVTIQMWTDLKALQSSLPNNPSTYTSNNYYPVHNVYWRECILFANLLSVQNGYTRCYYTDGTKTTPISSSNYLTGTVYCDFDAPGYRLPTEGEWEFFCRAGTYTPFSILEPKYEISTKNSCTTGVLPNLETVARYCATGNSISAVGSKDPNNWNLLDIHGNVLEWCWDGYDGYPQMTSTDYTGNESVNNRVLRGGAWSNQPQDIRSARRYYYTRTVGTRKVDAGFRLVRELD
jgi:sulfatase modifying factor 1